MFVQNIIEIESTAVATFMEKLWFWKHRYLCNAKL